MNSYYVVKQELAVVVDKLNIYKTFDVFLAGLPGLSQRHKVYQIRNKDISDWMR